jgi:hypothetical protein
VLSPRARSADLGEKLSLRFQPRRWTAEAVSYQPPPPPPPEEPPPPPPPPPPLELELAAETPEEMAVAADIQLAVAPAPPKAPPPPLQPPPLAELPPPLEPLQLEAVAAVAIAPP